jgi:hypothetical protein
VHPLFLSDCTISRAPVQRVIELVLEHSPLVRASFDDLSLFQHLDAIHLSES